MHACRLCGRSFASRNRLFGHFGRNEGGGPTCLGDDTLAEQRLPADSEGLDDAAVVVEMLAAVLRAHGGCMEVSAAGEALARSCPDLWARCRRNKAFSLIDLCRSSPHLLRVEETVREEIADRQRLADLGYRYLLHAVHDGPIFAGADSGEADPNDPTELCVALAKRVLEYSCRHELSCTKRAPAVWLVGRVARPISRQIGAASRYGRSRQQLCDYLKAFVANKERMQQFGYKFEWTESSRDGAAITLLEYPADLFALRDAGSAETGRGFEQSRRSEGPKDISLSPGAILVLLASQGGTCREKDVARLEFTSYTSSIGCGVRVVSPGVWEVLGAPERVLTAVCARVGAVRRHPLHVLTVVCNDEDELVAAVPASTSDLGGASWSLDFELQCASGSRDCIQETLPFQSACVTSLAVSIALKLASKMTNGRFVRARDAEVKLVVVQLRVPGKSTLILCRELDGFPLLVGQVRQTWEGRPFQFDASTTYSIASAVIHLALATVATRRHKRLDELVLGAQRTNEGLRFLDACTGTGTLLAAAVSSGAFGAGLVGCDIRSTFIEGARRNLQHAFGDDIFSTQNVLLAVQDARVQWHVSGCSPRFDVVAANPPWGLRFVCLSVCLPACLSVSTDQYTLPTLALRCAREQSRADGGHVTRLLW